MSGLEPTCASPLGGYCLGAQAQLPPGHLGSRARLAALSCSSGPFFVAGRELVPERKLLLKLLQALLFCGGEQLQTKITLR